jgi:hypothetical protein
VKGLDQAVAIFVYEQEVRNEVSVVAQLTSRAYTPTVSVESMHAIMAVTTSVTVTCIVYLPVEAVTAHIVVVSVVEAL